jgi:hypothetical protein
MEDESPPLLTQTNVEEAYDPTTIDLTANISDESNTTWKKKTLIALTEEIVKTVTPDLKIIAGNDAIQDPEDASIVVTEKGVTKSTLLVTNDYAGKHENKTAAAIATASEGDASALPTFTIILTGNTFQTAGKLLKAQQRWRHFHQPRRRQYLNLDFRTRQRQYQRHRHHGAVYFDQRHCNSKTRPK